MEGKALYFIAIIPPSPVFEHIQQIKIYTAQKYHCKQALRSPPHITLEPPFQYPVRKEHQLIQKIHDFNVDHFQQSIEITLCQYNVFMPKVVFIDVISTTALQNLYDTLHQYVKTEIKVQKDLAPRPFHPHITIAFRDVKKHLTLAILEDLQQHHPIQITFEFKHISILKHNTREWEVLYPTVHPSKFSTQ